MKQTRKYIGIAVAAMLLTQGAQAAETLPSLVVTADRLAQDQASVSADVTVITQQDIEQSQATNVANLLRSQAGLDVGASGGPGKSTSVFIRGASSKQTLVLIDGVRVGSATLGAFDWGNLSTAGIERIEIVRGAQSSLYGADAMGGVIQLFTRQGTKGMQVHVHGELGSLSSSKEGMDISGMSESGVSYAMSVEGLRTQGVSVAANGTEKDGFRSTTLSGRVGILVGQGKLELIARHVDGKTGLDGFDPITFTFGDVLNFTSSSKQSVASGKFTYPINDMLETSLQLSRSSDKMISRDPAGGFNNSDFTTRIDQLTWQNHIDLDAFSVLFGVDMHKDSGLSGSAVLDKSITQTAGFASASWSEDMVDINGSVRYDRNSVTQNKVTYKFGGALRPMKGLKLTANYGTGFKAPSINDLYTPGSGNLKLKPETSKGWDVGMAYEWEKNDLKTGVSATWFKQNFKNLIDWAPITPGSFTWLPSNVNAARTQGLELAGNIHYGMATLRGNWTYLDAKDSSLGYLLARRAKDSGNVSFAVDVGGLHAESSVHIVGARFSAPKNAKPMAGYHTTALRASYAINDALLVNARVENLENKKYEEVSGFGVLGRVWYAGMSTNF